MHMFSFFVPVSRIFFDYWSIARKHAPIILAVATVLHVRSPCSHRAEHCVAPTLVLHYDTGTRWQAMNNNAIRWHPSHSVVVCFWSTSCGNFKEAARTMQTKSVIHGQFSDTVNHKRQFPIHKFNPFTRPCRTNATPQAKNCKRRENLGTQLLKSYPIPWHACIRFVRSNLPEQ